jgi:hypothetical protein
MFGLELQTSGNFFTRNVLDREVAYRHGSNLLTIEGDETQNLGATSELEFVTAPCRTRAQAQEAVRYASALARELAQRAEAAQEGKLRFEEGEKFLGGTWVKECDLTIGDPGFAAKPQGTVGVPLASLKRFVDHVLRELGGDGKAFLGDLAQIRAQSGIDFDDDRLAELTGFLTACHIFILWAIVEYPPAMAVDEGGRPLEVYKGNKLRPRDRDSWRVVTLPAQSRLDAYEYDGDPAFFSSKAGCRVLVGRDSPKSMFKLLHRTDFYSMYRALLVGQQELLHRLPTGETGIPGAVWPTGPGWGDRGLFVFPYRADPPDPVSRENGQIMEYKTTSWPGGNVERPDEAWWLTERGPLISEWWLSVINGRPVPGQPDLMMPKDLASPPPGIRSRDLKNIANFPGADESKRDYYGMGAFPMDPSGSPLLAVYEHRAFADHHAMVQLGPPTLDTWGTVVDIFHDLFVSPFG